MSAHQSRSYPSFPDAPDWAQPLKTLPQNHSSFAVCIRVKPSADYPAEEHNPNYALGAPEFNVQDRIMKKHRERLDGFWPVDGCNLEVNAEDNTLRDMETGVVYQMEWKSLEFHVHQKPEWAMTLHDYYASDSGSKVPRVLGIIVRKEDETHEIAALPNNVQSIIKGKMDEEKTPDVWVDAGTEGGVILQVNISRAQIREATGKHRIYKLVHHITEVTLSNPYKDTKDWLNGKAFDNEIRQTKETVEVVETIPGDFQRAVVFRDTPILNCNNEIPMQKKTIAHGEFLWLYELTSPGEKPNQKKTDFKAKPYDQRTSLKLEEAMLRGDDSVDIEILVPVDPNEPEGPNVSRVYTVNLINTRMYQYRKDAPNYARRVWRFGTEVKERLREVYWPCTHKLRDLTVNVPSYWKSKGIGTSQHHLVDLTSSEGQQVLDYVKSSIEKYEGQKPVLGFAGKWLELTNREQPTTAGKPVHHKTESGEVVREKTRAIHIAALYRIEKPEPFKSYCAGKNGILGRRRGKFTKDSSSLHYLEENPLATGPILDERVNEVWGFNGANPEFAYQLLTDDTTAMNVRAASRENTFGKGLYFTDSFVKALKYCGCPICAQQQRNVEGIGSQCTCKDRNLTHPHIVFMTRLAMGKMLIVRDPAQFAMHCWNDNSEFPKMGFDSEHPVIVWYDPAVSTEAEARANFKTPVAKQVYVQFKELPIPPAFAGQKNALWFFYVKELSTASTSYTSLVKTIQERTEKMKWLSFGIIIDDDANYDTVRTALDLHRELQAHDANECFYIDSGMMLDEMLHAHEHDTDMLSLFSELYTEPGKGRRIELPDLKLTDEGEADSVLVEDTPHCTPASVLAHPESAPSMLQARQNKRREMVMFDHMATYTEYAILVYEYESPEAMIANLDKEYPRNPHGVPQPLDEKEVPQPWDPLHFLTQRFGPNSDGKVPVSLPGPDPRPNVCVPTSPRTSRGAAGSETPPSDSPGLCLLGESMRQTPIGDKFTFEQF